MRVGLINGGLIGIRSTYVIVHLSGSAAGHTPENISVYYWLCTLFVTRLMCIYKHNYKVNTFIVQINMDDGLLSNKLLYFRNDAQHRDCGVFNIKTF